MGTERCKFAGDRRSQRYDAVIENVLQPAEILVRGEAEGYEDLFVRSTVELLPLTCELDDLLCIGAAHQVLPCLCALLHRNCDSSPRTPVAVSQDTDYAYFCFFTRPTYVFLWTKYANFRTLKLPTRNA